MRAGKERWGGGGGGGGKGELGLKETPKKNDIAVESYRTQDTGLCAQKYMYLEAQNASEHTLAVILQDSSPMAIHDTFDGAMPCKTTTHYCRYTCN